MCFKCGDIFGIMVFIFYGLFWLMLVGLIVMLYMGLFVSFVFFMGWYLVLWGIFIGFMFIGFLCYLMVK